MTAEIVIYAVGGGSGHSVRGGVIASLLHQLGIRTHLITRAAGGTGAVLRSLGESSPHTRWLLVDTFPAGWRQELDSSLLSLFCRRILIARHSIRQDWHTARARFHDVLYPYPVHRSEWNLPPLPGLALGYLVRPDPMRVGYRPGTLLVLDPAGRCSAHLRGVLARIASESGLQVTFQTSPVGIPAQPSGSPDQEPQTRPRTIGYGQKVLVIGAGYNTVHELLLTGADIRFVPVRKRYDDQDGRCRHWGRLADSLESIRSWLASPGDPSAAIRLEDCCRPESFLPLICGTRSLSTRDTSMRSFA